MRRSLAADGRELAVVLPRRAAPPLTWQGGAAPVASLGKGFRAPCTTTGSVPAPGHQTHRPAVGCAATACPVASTIREALLPRSPQRRAFGPDPTTRDRPAPGPRPLRAPAGIAPACAAGPGGDGQGGHHDRRAGTAWSDTGGAGAGCHSFAGSVAAAAEEARTGGGGTGEYCPNRRHRACRA